jgi:RTX calcium-binding nonapeptide repeat (4 copies)
MVIDQKLLERRKSRSSLASLVAIGALIATSGTATAATTIGSNLAGSPTYDSRCDPIRPCTQGQKVLPPTSQAPGGVLAPYDGVVVRWRIKVGIETLGSALVITRPGSSDIRSAVGESPGVVPPAEQISTYETRLPMQAGDALGLDCCTDNFHGEYVKAITPGAVNLVWRVPVDLGSGLPGYSQPDQELLVNADIERDCDADGLGDESQDGSTSPCPTCKGAPATIIGTNGDDVRSGTPARDVMVGLGGNDTLSGLEGDDAICGGAGKDTLNGGPGNDTVLGQKGKDTLYGEAGHDALLGQKGKDTLYGQAGNDALEGNKGNDNLFGGEGGDKLKGGPGKDKLKGGPGKDKQVQ